MVSFAEATGIEPAISGLTGRRDNQLRYASKDSMSFTRTRFERMTYCLGGSCSILLSYRGSGALSMCLAIIQKRFFSVNSLAEKNFKKFHSSSRLRNGLA